MVLLKIRPLLIDAFLLTVKESSRSPEQGPTKRIEFPGVIDKSAAVCADDPLTTAT